jgi:hypothetical protein
MEQQFWKHTCKRFNPERGGTIVELSSRVDTCPNCGLEKKLQCGMVSTAN